ncbi:trehalose 6-phosphate synthase [Geoalkalibacter ferrihydriticus]|uniref:Glucosylglycerol-phosphate synthase n=2 Tax=Geoalkalibacter ferrihydriticus TaxID=392333 RepID=A0A0C2HKW8_9BACT|nr:trehalose-6-phosphate synthase [Geoalkalibacter ferrihydriticus]KIH77686.1 alpha,alpha-trehalose-phosphate synthase [Geoalkalibacter ferrihydriticus DSM 17813]SDL73745.1 trehalose 6-phosphate synthase [Geoalkalibacter ferrihydriticus]
MSKKDTRRLIAVSNRLPIVVKEEDGRWQLEAGAGGLVTALSPVLKGHRGMWIGWPGCDEAAPLDELVGRFAAEEGYGLGTVPLTQEEVEEYYEGFSNMTLWPLFHDLLGLCQFNPRHWEAYVKVNRRFAEVTATRVEEEDLIWVQDYQLMLMGGRLRELGVKNPLAFFLHIPFPSLDLFRRLPWKMEILRGLLEFDLVGFQTLRDRRNFVACARELLPELRAEVRRRTTLLRWDEREIRVGHFPISIDFSEFNNHARSRDVADAAWYLHEHYENRQLILGVDRLDYTKGIPERLLAFERALERYPELHGKMNLVQIVVPSRTQVPEYQLLKDQLDQLAGRINARFGQAGWIPIHYMFRSLDRVQLLAHYRAAEIALITPLRDGMNLVAKEYCAASVDNNGVLILSEFAGAAEELGKGAVLVNPYDIDGTAEAIRRACTMEQGERQRRMRMLRASVQRNNVHRWVEYFVNSL